MKTNSAPTTGVRRITDLHPTEAADSKRCDAASDGHDNTTQTDGYGKETYDAWGL